jgi:hypothetical protein
MKTSIKFATGLILAAATLVASGSAALAGEGGSAGSVSIVFTGGSSGTPPVPNVARLSTSVAVGKGFAVATARTGATDAFTSAVGAGGGFDLTDANGTNAAFSAVTETAADLAINQLNTFTGSGVTTLAPTSGVTLAD